jgi:hypothetical protein
MNRVATPDIMGNLMSGSLGSIDEKQENQQAIKQPSNINPDRQTTNPYVEEQENNKKIKLPKNKATRKDGGVEIIELKEKATFNLSQSTLLKLEDAWMQLRKQLKGEQRITKTAIVEMALEICIEELTQKENESTLYHRLTES